MQWLTLTREGKDPRDQDPHPRLETDYFSWGGFDWSLSVHPRGDSPSTESRPLVFLTRQTSFDHLCRTRSGQYSCLRVSVCVGV